MEIRKDNPARKSFKLDTNAIQQQTRQVQGTGLVKCGKEKVWQVEDSWMWGGKRYYGTLIPSKKLKMLDFKTNGKIKRLPKRKRNN